MILGVEHLALSCKGVEQCASLLDENGFSTQFIERNLRNNEAKRNFLGNCTSLHSIAYCQSKTSIAVELTDHGAGLSCGESPFKVLLNRRPPASEPLAESQGARLDAIWGAALGTTAPQFAKWLPFQTEVWYQSSEADVGSCPLAISAVLLPVRRLAVSQKFWIQGLGCTVVDFGKVGPDCGWVRVSIRSPVPTWNVEMILCEGAVRVEKPLLDQAGFPCLALISSCLEADCKRALDAGGNSETELFEIEVNDRLLKVGLLRGPDLECIELIQIVRR